METAGEGGAWGIAVLAAYMCNGKDMSLEDYLDKKVFAGAKGVTIEPSSEDAEGFDRFMERYKSGLPVERAACEQL